MRRTTRPSSHACALYNAQAFIGEVGLAGELRPVANLQRRLNVARTLGFSRCVVPSPARRPQAAPSAEARAEEGEPGGAMVVVYASRVADALHLAFAERPER